MEFSEILNITLMQGFAGLSLFSVLLLMGLGLAIIAGYAEEISYSRVDDRNRSTLRLRQGAAT